MSYSNRVNLHGYCNSFIHYFSICFSLLSTLSGSQLSLSTVCSLLTLTSHRFISPSIHRSHRSHSLPIRSQLANNIVVELRNAVVEFRWYDLIRTRPRNDIVAEVSGTWWVGFDGYWSGWWWLGFWWVGWIFWSVGFDLDRLDFFWFIGGFWWSYCRLGGWWFGLTGFRVGWVINGFWIEWVSDWVGWFFLMMLVGWRWWWWWWLGGDDGSWVWSDRRWWWTMGLWERGAVREWIIKNCKIMNILLNKCVE